MRWLPLTFVVVAGCAADPEGDSARLAIDLHNACKSANREAAEAVELERTRRYEVAEAQWEAEQEALPDDPDGVAQGCLCDGPHYEPVPDPEPSALCHQAATAYETFFSRYGAGPFAHELHFFWGELLYDELHDPRGAKREYDRALEADPHGKYASLAAYDAVLAAKDLSGEGFSGGDLEFVFAADRYRWLYPEGDHQPEVAARAALTLYLAGGVLEADARVEELVARFGDQQLAGGETVREWAAVVQKKIHRPQ